MVSSGMLRRVVLTRATRRNIPEDTIFHSHRRENLRPYTIREMIVAALFIIFCLAAPYKQTP
jgi:hypothetical protein